MRSPKRVLKRPTSFCTIELNTGVVPMPDPRLDKLAEIVKPQRILPTTMEFVDIAGW